MPARARLRRIFGAALMAAPAGALAAGTSLTICADPANMPYSNAAQEGFENRIAAMFATDLHAELKTIWATQRSGFFIKTLLSGACDAVVAAPWALSARKEFTATRPYFASSYVAVQRAGDPNRFTSFDDPWLKDARIGLQLVGGDDSTPPGRALTQRGLTAHLRGYSPWTSSQERIVQAVASGEIDIAFVWGPIAGYYAALPPQKNVTLAPIRVDAAMIAVPFVFSMAVVLRKQDTALRDRLQIVLDRHRNDIAALLETYHVPLEIPVSPTTLPTQ
jgi:mxaJ protein